MSLLSHNLQAFFAIVKTSTVHGAAKDIGLTQTGVTQRIRALEQDLGATLFVRSRRGMQLTSDGQALYRYCLAVKDLEGETLAQIQGAATQSDVRLVVSGPTSVMSSRIVPQCLPLFKKFERLLFTFNVDDLDSRIDRLRKGDAHLAILAPEQVTREMDSKILKPEKYILVASASWKGRRLQDILQSERIIDFDQSDSMSFSYLKQFKLLEQVSRERIFVNNNEALVEMFRAGVGFGVLTSEVAKPFLDRGEIILLNSGSVFENPLALAWYPRPQMPEYFKATIQSIR